MKRSVPFAPYRDAFTRLRDEHGVHVLAGMLGVNVRTVWRLSQPDTAVVSARVADEIEAHTGDNTAGMIAAEYVRTAEGLRYADELRGIA